MSVMDNQRLNAVQADDGGARKIPEGRRGGGGVARSFPVHQGFWFLSTASNVPLWFVS